MEYNHPFETKKLLQICLLILVLITSTTFAFGHGGKHSDKFTQLQALQKATKLFDQLVTKGKLDQSWETGLENVAISKRKNKGNDEVVVSFHLRRWNTGAANRCRKWNKLIQMPQMTTVAICLPKN
jgi:hypothetical protein